MYQSYSQLNMFKTLCNFALANNQMNVIVKKFDFLTFYLCQCQNVIFFGQ